MDSAFVFLIKSIVCTGILYGWYSLALKNRRLHTYNRFFLLFAFVAGLLVPLLHFNWYTMPKALPTAPAAFLLHTVSDTGPALVAGPQTHETAINWYLLTGWFSAAVSMVLVALLCAGVFRVLKYSRQYSRRKVNGIYVVDTSLAEAPFSFMHLLFWNSDTPLESESGELIFRHERAHIQQGHTYDKLACQLITAIFWLNPFFWLLKKELNIVHEFIADEAAITGNDTHSFATMLLQKHNKGSYLTATGHNFFSSPIKRRIIMLQANVITKHSLLRRMLVLPLMAGTVFIFSFGRHVEHHSIAPIKAANKIVLVVDAGHGGIDAGAEYGGLSEKDINLRIASRIHELSPEYNVEVHLTRSSDKQVLLADRVQIANKIHPDCFISLHVNDRKNDDPAKGNFDIITVDNGLAEQNKKLAKSIFENMVQVGGVQKSTISSGHKLYVLSHNSAPSVLLELGDIKDAAQMATIKDDTKLDALCSAILKGVVESRK